MHEQLHIDDAGELVAEELTWDGEPLWSPETVRESLFRADAFEQLPGQLAMPDAEEVSEL